MIHSRSATPDDIPWILGELKKFAVFLGTNRSLFPSEEYAKEKLQELIETQVFCIAESTLTNLHDGTQVGFIAGICGPHFFNPEIRVLSELFWWVTPEWRNTRAGALLFAEFMHCGRERADMVVMTLEEQSPVHEETLLRHGFKRYERNYVMEVR
jgi:hypothetical protein